MLIVDFFRGSSESSIDEEYEGEYDEEMLDIYMDESGEAEEEEDEMDAESEEGEGDGNVNANNIDPNMCKLVRNGTIFDAFLGIFVLLPADPKNVKKMLIRIFLDVARYLYLMGECNRISISSFFTVSTLLPNDESIIVINGLGNRCSWMKTFGGSTSAKRRH